MINQARDTKQAKTSKAHVERRSRLWLQIRAENPGFTQAEIEARLEQFGV
jgi:hypothetical protein